MAFRHKQRRLFTFPGPSGSPVRIVDPAPLVDRQSESGVRIPSISDLDLETSPRGVLLQKTVARCDEFHIRAGRSLLETVFMDIDERGRLVYLVIDNGRDSGMHALKPDECCILWHGIRLDFSSFTLFMRRMAVRASGALAAVEVSAYYERYLTIG